jgi:trehalose 6-phosphate synthase/phosphatase
VRAKKRVLFVDYGGTLIEREGMGTYVKHEFIGSARRRKLPTSVVAAIGSLSADPATELWLVTGLSSDVIGNTQLAGLPHLNIAAENGAVVSHGPGEGGTRQWQQDPAVLGEGLNAKEEWDSVKGVAEQIMREYQWRVTGAVIRSAATSVVFDYRNADPEWAQAQTKYLTGDLVRRLVSPLVRVNQRKSRVEVSLRGATRRQLVRHGLTRVADADFVAAIGDDASDEEMFAAVMSAFAGSGGESAGAGAHLKSVFTITVGRKRTGARYFLPDVAHVQLLLSGMAQLASVLPALSSDAEGGDTAAEQRSTSVSPLAAV